MDFDYAGIAHIIEAGAEQKQAQTERTSAKPEQSQPEPERKQPEPEQKQTETEQKTPAEKQASEDNKNSALYIDERVPKKLRDLMIANTVFEEEIQAICESKGFVTTGSRIWEYDKQNPGIVDGLLVADWDNLYKRIKEMREKQELPFN